MPISDIVAVVAQVQCFEEGDSVGSGSGFSYTLEEELYLITNRHVVIDEAREYHPDSIALRLHTTPNDIRLNASYEIDLYDEDEAASWLEHPVHGSDVDVVAIPLQTKEVKSQFFVKALGPENDIPADVDVAIGEDVQVIGYPLGFHDTVHNLPIVRNATLASIYPVPFSGRPYVLIDARLHRGTSGSPVMTKPTNILRKTDGSTAMMSGLVTYFVGVHSASLDMVDRNPARDEPLGLNVVWFASLIPEIIQGDA